MAESLRRRPLPGLRPFIEELWISAGAGAAASGATREQNLPNGRMHVVFRLDENPVTLFERGAPDTPLGFGLSVVGGARSSFYLRDTTAATISAGAVLRPGAARWLLGATARDLAERHTRLADLWDRGADDALDRLREAAGPARVLDTLEAILMERLPVVRALHPAVAMALARFDFDDRIGSAVAASGYSHRRFIALFRETVGLTPKRYARVRRFDRALRRWNADPAARWADVALDGGYSDQSHFAREFLAFAGLTPEQYRQAAPPRMYHVARVNFLQDGRRRAR